MLFLMIDVHHVLGPWMTTATITDESESTVDLLLEDGRTVRVHKARLRIVQDGKRMTIISKE